VRGAATTPGRGSRAVYDVLATVDADWLLTRVEAVARANRDRVEDLCASFAAFASGSTIKDARERARSAAADPTPRARTTSEMQFAASLVPCPTCAAPTSHLGLSVGAEAWVLSGKCPRCGSVRSFQFAIEGNPRTGAYERLELGDGRPSSVIDPRQLVAELDRLAPSLRDDPTALTGADWTTHKEAAERAYTCAVELAKFLPPGGGDVPGLAHGRAWIEHARDRAIARLDRVIADAPRIWAERGPIHPTDELRGLIAQSGMRRGPSVEELTAYLASRGQNAPRVRLWADAYGVHAEVELEQVSPEDVQDALLGVALPVEVDHQGQTTARVIVHFGRRARSPGG
jgi:hypothetical protein